MKDCREPLKSTSIYFDLIRVILNKGHRVFLTDVSKIWISESDNDRGIKIKKTERDTFINALKAELEIFNPLTVIAWGKLASNVARNDLKIQALEFPHPSGAANGAWARMMGMPATRENRLRFWGKEISKYL